MKKLNVLIICTFLILSESLGQIARKEFGNLVTENIPDIPDQLRDRLSQYQNSRGAWPYNWSSDGTGLLISTRFGDTEQVHYIDHPGGARKQLTFFREPIWEASLCPNKSFNGFIFSKDKGGDEFGQLYWFDLTKGTYSLISDGGRSQNSGLIWSDKGDQFIYVSTRRNGKDFDLYLANMENPINAKLILSKGGSWQALDWSSDGKKVIVQNYISANKSLLFILDLQSGELEEVNPSKEDISYGTARWAIDGKGLFYISDGRSEFLTLKYYDLNSKQSIEVTPSIKWNIESLIINKERNTIIFSVNESGVYRLYKLDTSTKKYLPLEGLPTGILIPVNFHPQGKFFTLLVNSPKLASDIFTYDIFSSELKQWTYSEIGGLDNTKFVSPTLIEYETFDKVDGKSRKIPAFYYKPEGKKDKIPVVIEIHGGPEGQSVPYFDPFRSFLTNELGVAIIAPNVRGSTGYGKSYLKLDNGFKREESVQDIGKLLEWIAKQPELDASRIAVSGGSYGGYMTLASMVKYNDLLRCGIDVVGISNFVTFLQNTEDYRKDLRRVEYGDERDPKMKEYLMKISPANNVEKITKPIFIVQGLNDPRVPVSESEQMKNKMQEKGREVWYLMAKDEGHGFAKKENITFQQLVTVLFLQKYLLD